MKHDFHRQHLLHCQFFPDVLLLLFRLSIFLVEMQFLFCAPPLSVSEGILYSPRGVGQFFPHPCGVSIREKHVLLPLVTYMAI